MRKYIWIVRVFYSAGSESTHTSQATVGNKRVTIYTCTTHKHEWLFLTPSSGTHCQTKGKKIAVSLLCDCRSLRSTAWVLETTESRQHGPQQCNGTVFLAQVAVLRSWHGCSKGPCSCHSNSTVTAGMGWSCCFQWVSFEEQRSGITQWVNAPQEWSATALAPEWLSASYNLASMF